ncbi:MAG: hypothetical protein ABFR53_03015 [Actinomycetota bacterium]
MGVVLNRLLQTIKLERDAFVWMDFNDRATGDAAMLVAGTQVLISIGLGLSLGELINPLTLASVLLGGVFFWVVYSGATYAVSRFLFDGHGTYAIYLRITGFAYPTLLVLIFVNRFISNLPLALIVSGAWFVLVVANGLTYVADLSIAKAAGSAIGGYILLIVVQEIFGNVFRF